MTMALLITFESSATPEQLASIAGPASREIARVPGLLSKTWIGGEGMSGGFYVFDSAAALEAYLSGPIVAQLKGCPYFSDFEVRRFDVDPELSRVTRGVAMSAAA